MTHCPTCGGAVDSIFDHVDRCPPGRKRSMSAKKIQVYQLPHFFLPRYGRVDFEPLGDQLIRKTKQWKVTVTHTSPKRRALAPFVTFYPAEERPTPAKYPNLAQARFYMVEACAIADGMTAATNEYDTLDVAPPIR